MKRSLLTAMLSLLLAACGSPASPQATTTPTAGVANPTPSAANSVSAAATSTPSPTPAATQDPTVVPTAMATLENGMLVDVGGYKLHIQCTGTGSPTVVMTPNLQQAVQVSVGEFARVCSYFPAGVGLSEPPPGTRTSRALAKDLHRLLRKAGVPGPYVMVRVALGGLTGQAYAYSYPDQTAGLVLVDSPHPDVLLGSKDPYWSDPSLNQELVHYKKSAQEIRRIKTLGDVPLAVISQGIPDLPPALQTTPKAWQKSQKQLAALSTNSLHVIATRSGHSPQTDQPELVVGVIGQVVEGARRPGHKLHECDKAIERLGGRCMGTSGR